MEENFAEGKKEKEESCRPLIRDAGRYGLDGTSGQELREFNRLYKRLDDLYHSLSLKMGMSDSTFIILYSIAELGGRLFPKRDLRTGVDQQADD